MKTLKNKFESYQLTRGEMKSIGGGRDWHCRCDAHGAYAPYNNEWDGYYEQVKEIQDVLERRCVNGGTCS